MTRKDIYWLDGPWPGKLGMAARPRGGDWLKDDIAGWKRARIDTVLSLLTPEEEIDLVFKMKQAKSGPREWNSPHFRFQIARFHGQRQGGLKFWKRLLALFRTVEVCLFIADKESGALDYWPRACS